MSRRKRAKKDPVEEAEEESGLEKLLFGDDEIGERFGTETAGQDTSTEQENEGPASVRRPVWEDDDDDEVEVNVAQKTRLRKLRKAEDEEVLEGGEYSSRLREQFVKMNGEAKWAMLPSQAAERKRLKASRKKRAAAAGGEADGDEGHDGVPDDGAAFLASTNKLLDSAPSILPRTLLRVTRMRDANAAEPSDAVVRATKFHPQAPLLMTAGFDKSLRFFQVDGKRNPKVQGVFFEDLPIHTADYLPGGTHVVAAGRRKFFYVYDMVAGKVEKVNRLHGRDEKSLESFVVSPFENDAPLAFFGKGALLLVSGKTRQLVGTLQAPGNVRAAAFGSEHTLFSAGDGGTIYIWDLRMRRIRSAHQDQGAIHCTALAASRNGGLYAAGSDSGVVNIYKHTSGDLSGNQPVKKVMNLTTPINDLLFNPDEQMLAMSSHHKKECLRMVHCPSFGVFSNWPTAGTPLHYVSTLAFSPSSGYFATGNDKGKVLLYRLNHFKAS